MSGGVDFQSASDLELERWPGATGRYEHRGKHMALVIGFGGRSRFVIFPQSGSDSMYSVRNHISTMRKELRALGAVRDVEAKACRVERGRVLRALPRPRLSDPPTRLAADPWEALRGL